LDERGPLFAIVEFGVGLAGFAAIFVGLVRRVGAWEAASAYRLELLLIQSLSASLFALLPVALELLGVPPTPMWRLSSMLLVLALVVGFFYARSRFRRLPTSAQGELSAVLLHGGTVLILLCVGVLISGSAGMVSRSQAGSYYLVLVLLLFASVLNFIRTVTTRPRPSA